MGAKDIFLDFASWTTAHGVPHIGSSKNWPLRSFWILLVLGLTATFFYQLYCIILQYLQYDVNTVTTIMFQDIFFPEVTVCSLSPYRLSALMATTKAPLFKSLFDDTRSVLKGGQSKADYWNYHYLDHQSHSDYLGIMAQAKTNLMVAASTLTPAERNASVLHLDDLVVSCSYNLNDCVMNSDFVTQENIVYGNCFRFNSQPNSSSSPTYRSSRAGPLYGLVLVLKSDQSDYLPLDESAGFRLLVDHPSHYPFPSDIGSNIAIGFATSVAVSFVTNNRLPQPYGDCTSGTSDDLTIPFLYPGEYTVEGCYRSCYQLATIAACKCCSPLFVCPADEQICQFPWPNPTQEVRDQYACMQNMSSYIQTAFDPFSQCHCPYPCSTTTYSTTISTALWPAENYTPDECKGTSSRWKGDTEACHAWYAQNTALVEVYYETLSYQDYTENPAYTIVNLVTDMGGSLGLFMGFSLITAVEILSLILLLCIHAGKKATGRKV